MGRCVRIRSTSKPLPPPVAPASSCLTLRSGRRVLPVAASSSSACSPRTSGRRPRRHSGSALRSCGDGAAIAKNSACGSPRRSTAAVHAERTKEEVPTRSRAAAVADTGAAVARGVDVVYGDSFEKPKTALMTDDCDAAVVKAKTKAKHENERHRCRGVVAGQTPPPPTEAELEAFFAASELAERRRFAEAYNYDVALDRPLEGRFEWTPVST